MAEHTPGPWVVESVEGPYPHDICLGYNIPGEGSPILLATVFYDEQDNEPISAVQANANARLIAAAPDLLSAARMMIEAPHDSGRWKAKAALVAAIAKAEGKEQP